MITGGSVSLAYAVSRCPTSPTCVTDPAALAIPRSATDLGAEFRSVGARGRDGGPRRPFLLHRSEGAAAAALAEPFRGAVAAFAADMLERFFRHGPTVPGGSDNETSQAPCGGLMHAACLQRSASGATAATPTRGAATSLQTHGASH